MTIIATWLLAGCRARPALTDASPKRSPDAAPSTLQVAEISFAGPAGHRRDASFMPGETVLCLFSASGFVYEKHRAEIRADLRVVGPEGQLVLLERDLEVLKGAAPSLRPGTLRTMASLAISPAAPVGRHTVTITLRDRLGGGQGSGQGQFTLLGAPPAPRRGFGLTELRWAGGDSAPAGAVLPVAFVATHFSTARDDGGHRVEHAIETQLRGPDGRGVTERRQQTVRRVLPFAPAAWPAELLVELPRLLAPGPYPLAVEARDRVGGGRAKGELALRVVAAALGIHTVHVHDAAGLPRDAFLLGEQIFVRFAVHGLAIRAGQVDASVDLAVAGPDGGVYLARKGAASASGTASRAVADAGRFPAQLPLVLPAVAPAGKYRLVLRVRDGLARREVVREHAIELRGHVPPRLADFKVDALEVRDRPDLPPGKGDTLGAGRTYHLTLSLGGARLRQKKKLLFEASVEADLRLRDLTGKVVQEQRQLFAFARELTYQPLRILVPASFTVRSDLRGGLYDLEVEASDRLGERASQLKRRIEIVGAGPAVPVQLP